MHAHKWLLFQNRGGIVARCTVCKEQLTKEQAEERLNDFDLITLITKEHSNGNQLCDTARGSAAASVRS